MKLLGISAVFFSLIFTSVVRADRVDELEKQVEQLVAQQKQMQQDMAQIKAQLARLTPLSAGVSNTVAATTKPSAGPNGIRWIVTVVSNTPANVENLRPQLASEQKNLIKLQKRADDLHKRAAEVASAQTSTFDRASNQWINRPQYDSNTISQAQIAANSADDDIRKSKTTIARLQRQIDDAQTSRTVLATLDNGQAVEVVGTGDVYRPVAESMVVGNKYSIDGTRSSVDGKVTIKLRTILPVSASPALVP